jgi:hypothetical protein
MAGSQTNIAGLLTEKLLKLKKDSPEDYIAVKMDIKTIGSCLTEISSAIEDDAITKEELNNLILVFLRSTMENPRTYKYVMNIINGLMPCTTQEKGGA